MEVEKPIGYPIGQLRPTWPLARSRAYELAAAGILEIKKIGRTTVVTRESLERWWASLPSNKEVA